MVNLGRGGAQVELCEVVKGDPVVLTGTTERTVNGTATFAFLRLLKAHVGKTYCLRVRLALLPPLKSRAPVVHASPCLQSEGPLARQLQFGGCCSRSSAQLCEKCTAPMLWRCHRQPVGRGACCQPARPRASLVAARASVAQADSLPSSSCHHQQANL
jgi:hypothetical protein